MRIFDKEKYIENMGVPIGCEERWVNECDGKKVVRVEEDDETYQVVGLPYNVAKVWTKEVDDIKTLEELGHEKSENEYNIVFRKDNTTICFVKKLKVFSKDLLTNNGKFVACNVTMEELKAIYKYCEDLGWI